MSQDNNKMLNPETTNTDPIAPRTHPEILSPQREPLSLFGTWGSPREERNKVAGERDNWTSLCSLVPSQSR